MHESIVAALKHERDTIDRAIRALSGQDEQPNHVPAPRRATRKVTPITHNRLSAAARKRLSEMMKARWAERRRLQNKGKKAA